MVEYIESKYHITKQQNIYSNLIKRTFDFFLAILLLVITLPVMLAIAVTIKITSKGSVLYRALRGGYHNVPFYIYKFRTMVENADEIGGGTTALNDVRITRVGTILRKTKLDEIPQLINVLKGEMSFVGPRPELLKYTNLYLEEELLIYEVRPGITDYSSLQYISLDEVVGEENADYYYETHVLKEKNRLRVKYAKEISAKVDIKIFLLTFLKVMRKCFKFFCVR